MYSLYRAWLSMSQTPDLQPSTSLPLNLSSAPAVITQQTPAGSTNAPDVQLQVGPSLTNFSAHRNVLSAHSGFFKAALNNYASSTSSAASSTTAIGPILVPNIAVDEFSSLLTFMYTGYLDLNLGNIYNILLATHILHMPRALELCRNFLMTTQQQQQQQQQIECHPPIASTSTIIKPIASRKPLPNVFAIKDAPRENNEAKEKKVFNKSSVFKIYTNADKPMEDVEESAPSTSKTTKSSSKMQDNTKSQGKATKKDKKRRISSLVAQPASALVEEQRVIVDIACCDGPVRFHRVVNKNYGRKPQVLQVQTQQIAENVDIIADTDASNNKKRNTLAAINKIMTENIKLANTNSKDAAADEVGENLAAAGSSDLYTCLYCNHTFKSQYCYQKHARRHLNPVDAVKTPPESETQQQQSSSSATSATTKREFKLLDMNVQYYPCKTCGSKFPSYYFVHKHRKLCHADEMADGTNKNNEIVQVKPKAKKGSGGGGVVGSSAVTTSENLDDENSTNDVNAQEETTSDIIDVEETN